MESRITLNILGKFPAIFVYAGNTRDICWSEKTGKLMRIVFIVVHECSNEVHMKTGNGLKFDFVKVLVQIIVSTCTEFIVNLM